MQMFYAIRIIISLILSTQTIFSMEKQLPIVRTYGPEHVFDTEKGIVKIKEALASPSGSTEYTSTYGSIASISSQSDTAGLLYMAEENVETLKHLFAVSAATSERFGQKELLLYQEIVKLYKKVKKTENDFFDTLDEAQQMLILNAYKEYSRLENKLFSAISNGNIENFEQALLAIMAATYRPQDFQALNNDELKIAITLLHNENNRIYAISEHLDSFVLYPWIAKHPKKTGALIAGSIISFESFINILCYCILHKLSTNDVISVKTVIGVFALTNILVIGIVVSFLCFFPLKFICCNSNNAKLATKAIEEMKKIIDQRRLDHITLLAEAQTTLQLRQLGQQEANTDLD